MEISYHRELGRLEMCCKMEKEESAKVYPLQMCIRNTLKGLLPCSLQCLDGKNYVCWDITSRYSMREFGKRKGASEGLLSRVLLALYETMREMEGYMIRCEYLLPDPEYIYLDAENRRVWFVCNFEEEDSFHSGILRLAEFCLSLVEHSRQEEVRLGYGLYRLAVQDQFPREAFEQLLFGQEEPEEEVKVLSADMLTNKEEKQAQPEEVFASFWEEGEDKEKRTFSDLIPLYALLIGIAVVITEVVVFVRNGRFLPPGWLAFGFCLFLLCLSAAIISGLWQKRKREREAEKEEALPGANPKIRGNGAEKEEVLPGANLKLKGNGTEKQKNAEQTTFSEPGIRQEKSSAAEKENRAGQEDFSGQSILSGQSAVTKQDLSPEKSNFGEPDTLQAWGETMLLKAGGSLEGKQQKALLEERQGGRRFLLPEQGAILGSWQEAVDICLASRVVSRMHARLYREEDKWKIRDLHSRNGTWVNDEALTGDKAVGLKNGDEIRFADQIYLFKLETINWK